MSKFSELMERKRIGNKELSEITGVCITTIKTLKNGKNKHPQAETIKKLSSFFGDDINNVFESAIKDVSKKDSRKDDPLLSDRKIKGEKLLHLIKSNDYNMSSFSRETGLSYNCIYDLVHGHRKRELRKKTVNVLVKYLGDSVLDIMDIDDPAGSEIEMLIKLAKRDADQILSISKHWKDESPQIYQDLERAYMHIQNFIFSYDIVDNDS